MARLKEIPGIGAGTAARIAMHALGDPDILPVRHPGAHRWRPWRAYAAMHLEAGS
jgi:AraC family transcriptional regulator of adaptative response / DNA-3-methyladenine glycosylase II